MANVAANAANRLAIALVHGRLARWVYDHDAPAPCLRAEGAVLLLLRLMLIQSSWLMLTAQKTCDSACAMTRDGKADNRQHTRLARQKLRIQRPDAVMLTFHGRLM
jgi:hypothetical protein